MKRLTEYDGVATSDIQTWKTYNNGEKVWYFWFDDDDDDDDDIDDHYDDDDDDDDDNDDDNDDDDEVQIFLSDHSNLIWTHTIWRITRNSERTNYILGGMFRHIWSTHVSNHTWWW